MSKKCINENNWESKALESRLVTVSAVDNQEFSESQHHRADKNSGRGFITQEDTDGIFLVMSLGLFCWAGQIHQGQAIVNHFPGQ